MFRVILYTQWKAARWVLLLAVIAAGTIPLQALRSLPYKDPNSYHIPSLYQSIESAGQVYQLLALAVAVVVAVSAWQADGRRQHVYSLSLPLPHWQFVLLRFGAGAVLLGVVAAAVGLFGGVAAALAPLPPMLHAYPVGLALRFWLGALIPFGLVFALLGSNPRRVRLVMTVVVAIIVVDITLAAIGLTQSPVILGGLADLLYGAGGPLTAFTSRWMLIDV